MKEFRTSPNGGANGARPSHPASNGLQSGTALDVHELAARWELKAQPNGKWSGPHPTDKTQASKDGFTLCPEGNAFTNGGQKYTSREVALLAGIEPDQYKPVAQWKEQRGPAFPNRREVRAPKPKAAPTSKTPSPRFDWTAARRFDYIDEAGELLFQVGRLDGKPSGDGPTGKQFRQRMPDPQKTGAWIYKLDGARRVLWRLPDVLSASTVWVCEGEKAAARLNDAFEEAGVFGQHVATTNAQGALKWRDELAAPLDGRAVVVLPDNDSQGDRHGATVCASAKRAGALDVRRLDLPELPAKGDVCEWLDAGGSVPALFDLAGAAPLWEAPDVATFDGPALNERTPDAACIPAPSLRTERGAPEYDARQLVELLYPDWTAAGLGTQGAMSERARDALSDVLRYVPALGWLWFDGRKWTLDDKAATGAGGRVLALSGRVREEAAALMRVAATLAQSGRAGDAEAMNRAAGAHLRHARQVEARGFVEGAVHFAAGHAALRATVDRFDARPFVLGFGNGVWDKGDFRPHRREDFLLHLCPVEWDFHADRRQWEAVLERMTGEDAAFARTLQDVAGYVLSGAPTLRVLPWLYGPKGTGKSTFAELLQTVLGEQSAQIDTKALDGSDARDRLGAALWNRRLAVCSESGNKKLDAELLKTLSGGDRLPVRLLYKEQFTALPRHVLMMVANDAPRLDAYDGALKDRVLALPFEHRMSDGEPLELTGSDGEHVARIEAARVDPASLLVRGFTAWALDGLARVHHSQSIERAPRVVEATAKFWSDTDTLTPFWDSLEVAQLDAMNGQGITKSDLRRAYEQWCEEEGARPLGPRHWTRACESRGLEDCWLARQGASAARGYRFKTRKNR